VSTSPGFAARPFAGSIGIASAAAVLVQVVNIDDPRVARIAAPAPTETRTFGTTTGPGGDGQIGDGGANSVEAAGAAVGSGEGDEGDEGPTTREADGDGAIDAGAPVLAAQATAGKTRTRNVNESPEPLFRADPARADIATPHRRQPGT
jgi:hypothetical protein